METTGTLGGLLRRFGGDDGEEKARLMFEAIRWPNGPICPHCGATDPYTLKPRTTSEKPGRPGLYKCRAKPCRKQFTIRVKTIMEDSPIPYATWAIAFHMLSSSKKGISAHWIHRNLWGPKGKELDYKSAWFMMHRIREAMKRPPLSGKLEGIVEADETYVGGRPRAYEKAKVGRPGPTSKKTPVVTLVERSGRARSFHLESVTAATVRPLLREQIELSARLMTDDFNPYRAMGREFAEHRSVNHSAKEYVRGEAHTQTVEGFFSILKRGLNGVYHHVGRQHLSRYLAEFDFRYTERFVSDGERAALAIKGAEGRRLTYREPARVPLT